MELDRTKIGIWIEYFCRFDESKYWGMTTQLQQAEEQLMRTVSVRSYQKQLDFEVEALMLQLQKNHERIQKIRNLASQNEGDIVNDENEQDDQAMVNGGNSVVPDYIEVPKNDSITLNRDDLQIIQLVEQKLRYMKLVK